MIEGGIEVSCDMGFFFREPARANVVIAGLNAGAELLLAGNFAVGAGVYLAAIAAEF